MSACGGGPCGDGGATLVVFHPIDPRGTKLGGIETHVRLILAHHPRGTRVLLVGADEIGDRSVGRVARLQYGDNTIDFLPVLRVEPGRINEPARRITRSLTFRFTLAALRHGGAVRRAIGAGPASADIGRFEFVVLPSLLGLPIVLTVHNEGRREDAMDSLLKRHWWMHRVSERIALRRAGTVFAVNGAIAERIAGMSPRFGGKTRMMSVSVDCQTFRPSPFPAEGDALRVCFAGRLDLFKNPALMFAALALAGERLAAAPVRRFRRLAFAYAGASDPAAVAGYDRLAAATERCGVLDAAGVAALMRRSHIGIITSVFEGLPCYLLEMLACGRPVAAVALPQFAGLVADGISGRSVPRPATAASMAEALLATAGEIADERLRPDLIAALAQPFAVENQMALLFDAHRAQASAQGVGDRGVGGDRPID